MAAFMECSNLRNVFIGDGMERIGINAFLGCTSIAKIVCKAVTPPTCDTWALGDINKKTCSLVVPKGSKLSYQNANQWKDFFHIEEEGSTDDIKDVCINNSIIRSYGNVLRVSDAPTGSQINVYDLSGQFDHAVVPYAGWQSRIRETDLRLSGTRPWDRTVPAALPGLPYG